LPNYSSGEKFRQYGLDVKDRSPVDRVQFSDEQTTTFATQNAANRAPYPIRTILAALGEDSDLGPVWIVPRVAGSHGNF
jgi:hypothetical protein